MGDFPITIRLTRQVSHLGTTLFHFDTLLHHPIGLKLRWTGRWGSAAVWHRSCT